MINAYLARKQDVFKVFEAWQMKLKKEKGVTYLSLLQNMQPKKVWGENLTIGLKKGFFPSTHQSQKRTICVQGTKTLLLPPPFFHTLPPT